jgi:uncharacterized protein YbbC (DUF1343 family)
VTFRPRSPGDGKYSDTTVRGLRLSLTDRARYDPTATAVRLLAALRATHPDSFAFRPSQFDRLAGGPDLRRSIEQGESPARIAQRWNDRIQRYREWRRSFLLYPE